MFPKNGEAAELTSNLNSVTGPKMDRLPTRSRLSRLHLTTIIDGGGGALRKIYYRAFFFKGSTEVAPKKRGYIVLM